MNPVRTQTISRLVWISFDTSKGRRWISGSGPRYFAMDSNPNTICSPYSSSATTKYGYATACVRKRIGGLLSLERREVRDELIDFLGLQDRPERRHDRLAAGAERRTGHDIGAWIENRFAEVLGHRACGAR